MNILKLGIIGVSEGNGHPYSWSAIFNGYNKELMEQCGFPVIPRYLELKTFPEDSIIEANVTHIWTQDDIATSHIADTANVSMKVDNYTDLIGQVDGVLLARDDAENHVEMALPFLDAGLPIYIDKPLALSLEEAKKLISAQRYPGQLFTCSALRYASEFKLSKEDHLSLGEIRYIDATVPKDWNKYAVHVIEPALSMIPNRGEALSIKCLQTSEVTTLVINYESNVQLTITTLGSTNCPISIRVFGEKKSKELVFKDTYEAFKGALNDFVQSIIHKDVRVSADFMMETVAIIEAGRKYVP